MDISNLNNSSIRSEISNISDSFHPYAIKSIKTYQRSTKDTFKLHNNVIENKSTLGKVILSLSKTLGMNKSINLRILRIAETLEERYTNWICHSMGCHYINRNFLKKFREHPSFHINGF